MEKTNPSEAAKIAAMEFSLENDGTDERPEVRRNVEGLQQEANTVGGAVLLLLDLCGRRCKGSRKLPGNAHGADRGKLAIANTGPDGERSYGGDAGSIRRKRRGDDDPAQGVGSAVAFWAGEFYFAMASGV